MDNTIQLYVDKKKGIKGYPITSPDRVIDENGVNIKDYVDEAINEAKLEAKRRIELANDEINAEIMQKQNDIKDQIVTIAFMAAEKIVGKEIDKNTYLNEVTNIIDSGLKNE